MEMKKFSQLQPGDKFISFAAGTENPEIEDLKNQKDEFLLMEKIDSKSVRVHFTGELLQNLKWEMLPVVHVKTY